MPFLRNAWYLAAWANELPADELFNRTILNESVLLYRDLEGAPIALSNICPHRFAPLHKGKLKQGAVECPYHGLVFGTDGRCVHNPHGEGHIPANLKVRNYPVCERFGGIWIWTGEPERADESLLPDFGFLDPAHNVLSRRRIHLKANYMLIAENNLDVSHLQYMHANTVGSNIISSSKPEFSQQGHTIRVKRVMRGEKPPPSISKVRAIEDDILIDRVLDVRWNPPAALVLTIRVTRSGTDEELSYLSHSGHFLTPETESSTHQFFAFGLPAQTGEKGQKFVETSADFTAFPFKEEDGPILEAQQETVGNRDFMSLQPKLLAEIDHGAGRARNLMNKLIAEELKASVLQPA